MRHVRKNKGRGILVRRERGRSRREGGENPHILLVCEAVGEREREREKAKGGSLNISVVLIPHYS